MTARARARRAAGTGCRALVVGLLLALVTMLTGDTFSVAVALLVAAPLVAHLGRRRR